MSENLKNIRKFLILTNSISKLRDCNLIRIIEIKK